MGQYKFTSGKGWRKYYQKLFSSPIRIHKVSVNQNTGESNALISSRDKWFIVLGDNESAQEFGTDKAGAEKEFYKYKGE